MKAALATGLGTIVAVACVTGAVVLLSRGQGGPKGALKPAELAWIHRYYQWLDAAEQPCKGIPPAETAAIKRIERLARRACRGDIAWARVDGAIHARLFYSRPLPETSDPLTASHVDPTIGRVASDVAERNVEARCWSEGDWTRVNEEFLAIYPQTHYWVTGLAEPGGRVHFNGLICQTLARFYNTNYTPSANSERAVLASALALLAHESLHEYDSSYSEAVVECYAVQYVRFLVTEAGRSRKFAAVIAGFAWDVSYTRGSPIYSTGRCRNGGPLDLYPNRSAWP